MPANRKLTMRHPRGILRLRHERTPMRNIVCITDIVQTTIPRALERSKAAGLVSPFSEAVADDVLEVRSFACAGTKRSAGVRKLGRTF